MRVASKLSILLAVVLVAGLQTLNAQASEVHSDHTPPVKTDTPPPSSPSPPPRTFGGPSAPGPHGPHKPKPAPIPCLGNLC